MEIIETLNERNTVLYWFGLLNLVAAVLFLVLAIAKPIVFAGTNAWYKPIKFALSTQILCWSIAWFSGYLANGTDLTIANWIIIIMLGFEVIYIAWQASRGAASHYNVSTPLYASMYTLMALAASVATIAVGYYGLKFFITPPSDLPVHYLWSIRLGFLFFFLFSFQGFSMGSRMSHSVGGADGSPGIPFLNWSLTYGDLRIAHFIGMHALQVLPLLAWYVLKNLPLTLIVGSLYGLLAIVTLVLALRGKSIIAYSIF